MRRFANRDFGEKLAGLRALKRWSLEQVADKTGIPLSTYRRYEQGTTEKIPFEDVIRLGAAYGMNPNEMALLGGLWEPEEAIAESKPKVSRWSEDLANLVLDLPEPQAEDFMRLIYRLGVEEVARTRTSKEAEVERLNLPSWVLKRMGIPEEDLAEVESEEDESLALS